MICKEKQPIPAIYTLPCFLLAVYFLKKHIGQQPAPLTIQLDKTTVSPKQTNCTVLMTEENKLFLTMADYMPNLIRNRNIQR